MKTLKRNTIEEVCAEILSFSTPAVKEVDNGIGSFEYWGAKGVDIQLDGEVEEMEDIKISLHFRLQKLNLNILSENFGEFLEGLIIEVNDAVQEIEEKAKRRVALAADEYGRTDYSDIIKLSYITSIELQPCSVEIESVSFLFTWIDAREV